MKNVDIQMKNDVVVWTNTEPEMWIVKDNPVYVYCPYIPTMITPHGTGKVIEIKRKAYAI